MELNARLARFGVEVVTREGRGRCLVATRSLTPGTLALSSLPLACAPFQELTRQRCGACFERPPIVRRCGACDRALFCDRACQAAAWVAGHSRCAPDDAGRSFPRYLSVASSRVASHHSVPPPRASSRRVARPRVMPSRTTRRVADAPSQILRTTRHESRAGSARRRRSSRSCRRPSRPRLCSSRASSGPRTTPRKNYRARAPTPTPTPTPTPNRRLAAAPLPASSALPPPTPGSNRSNRSRPTSSR